MFKDSWPNHEKFFDLFQHSAVEMVKSARIFSKLVQDTSQIIDCVKEIKQSQQVADNYTQTAFDFLYKTFVTPFDKYDMHQLACQLDNVTHAIGSAAESILLYKINVLPKEIVKIAELAIDVSVLLQASLNLLEHLRNAEKIIRFSHDIFILQRQVEKISANGIAQLLNNTLEINDILKIKDVYDRSVVIFNESYVASNIIKSIVLAYS